MKSFLKNLFQKKNTNILKEVSAPIQFDKYNKERSNTVKKTFCQAPSINLYFSWEGKVIACCFNQDFILGHYPEQSIADIWNGEKIKELRVSLQNYDLSKGCASCQFNLQNSDYETANSLRFDEYPVAEYPQMMEFQLGSTCNLACVMCNGHLSSTIRKNREGLPPIPMRYDEKFVDELEQYIPHLKFTNFSGGEPFLIDIYYSIWDKIIELNPACIIKITTNGNVLNNKVKTMLEKGNFDLTVSLDSIYKERYEGIRIGASYERVMKNIQYFSDYCTRKNTRLNLNFCPMVNNWQEIPAYFNFCKSINATVYFSIVYQPINLSIQSLSIDGLKQVISFVEDEFKKLNITDSQNLFEWSRLKGQIKNWIKFKKEDLAEKMTKDKLLIFLEDQLSLIDDKFLEQDNVKRVIKNLFEEINNDIINPELLFNAIKDFTPDAFKVFFNSENSHRKDLFNQFRYL